MPGMLRWQARHRPDAVAVICGDQWRTYAELDARSERIAAGLLAGALARGDRVAVLLANRIEYLEIYQAAARSGLALVPVNPALTGPEIEYILADSGATLLIADAGLAAGLATGLPVITGGHVVPAWARRCPGWTCCSWTTRTGRCRRARSGRSTSPR
jgi:long-chain acyl-CoA synthetase